MQKNTKRENIKENIKYYNSKKHRYALIAYLVLSFALCAFIFPWILKLLYLCFEFFGFEETNLLPDFLGGLCGILIAAILDSTIISRLAHLKKYDAIVDVLISEVNVTSEYLKKEQYYPGYIIPIPILESIVNSYEAISIFYNLPRYFWGNEKGIISEEIRKLATSLKSLNVILGTMPLSNLPKDKPLSVKEISKVMDKLLFEKFKNCIDDSLEHISNIKKAMINLTENQEKQ